MRTLPRRVVRGLLRARTMALAGEQVVLVEADLRRPTFHEQFQFDRDPRGLTNALVGGVSVRELRRPALPGLRTLTVVPADKPAESTVIHYDEIAFDVPLAPDTFSLRTLQR